MTFTDFMDLIDFMDLQYAFLLECFYSIRGKLETEGRTGSRILNVSPEKIRVEFSFCSSYGVGDVISNSGLFTSQLTNSRHN